MTSTVRARPEVVSREQWLDARKALLAKEKEATKARDRLNAERRRLPMVKVEKDYAFTGPDGRYRLADLFDGRSQLYVHHFMWIDETDTGCSRCTGAADQTFTPPILADLHDHDVTFVAIARAPYPKIQAFTEGRGWMFPFYSSAGSDFNYDLHTTLDEDRAPVEYNYRTKDELLAQGFTEQDLRGDWPVNSVFLRDGDDVFHTYSAFARGMDHMVTPYTFLDLTPYGRQEQWEDSPTGWPKQYR
ncbi:DUF899 domain-containing protein [Actinocrispum wychmicini]|uniref:Putative dithiol-disulfide oxidoreductase (DUF899 family) n=1 Tax=Actinocrispum wychmicini TaxID=1213861 RepID=A0A4R2JVC8_9PSEU|nr:DUF899 domain-containing protein [Actinocrispum wychmicini]TCO61009.1 putative dithiol-disulfide oxidoreductase (DUF899 family) [Actinocrispum wychmicini]